MSEDLFVVNTSENGDFTDTYSVFNGKDTGIGGNVVIYDRLIHCTFNGRFT